MGISDERTADAELLSEASRLIEQGDYALAEAQLQGVLDAESFPSREFLRLKLAVRSQTTKPAVAMQRLVQLMQDHKSLPGAHEFYSEVSEAAYKERTSSLAFSHPPPRPARGNKG